MKIRFVALFSFLCLLLVGCSGVRPLGSVGSTRFYAVRARSLDGPNITALVTQDPSGVTVQATAGGQGLGHTVIAAAGNVGGAAAFGLSLRPSRTYVENGSNSTAASDSEANSAASAGSTATSTGAGHVNNVGNSHGGSGIVHGHGHGHN